MKIINPKTNVGHVKYALTDFDGTISLLRRDWQKVMTEYMINCIGGERVGDTVRAEFENFIKRSAGVSTIVQMRILAGMAKRYGNDIPVRSPQEYKRGYVETLKQNVRKRMNSAAHDSEAKKQLLVPGIIEFLSELRRRGVALFLFSGTDQADVEEELEFLGVKPFFKGQIAGAQRSFRRSSKSALIRQIMGSFCSHSAELLVMGDGPVEIKHGKRSGAVTLGVATNEFEIGKMNPEKEERLVQAGADVIVPDFSCYKKITEYFFPSRS